MKIDVRKTLVVLQKSVYEEVGISEIFNLFSFHTSSYLHPCPRLIKPIIGRNIDYCTRESCSLCIASFLDKQEDEFKKELGDDFIPCVTEKH